MHKISKLFILCFLTAFASYAHGQTTSTSGDNVAPLIIGETFTINSKILNETFLLEPDLFDTYIAFDPSLWWNDHKLVDNSAERLLVNTKLNKTLYFASSGEDTAEFTQRFADALEKNAASSVHWHYEKMPDEKHSTIYHPAALRAFRTLFKPAAASK